MNRTLLLVCAFVGHCISGHITLGQEASDGLSIRSCMNSACHGSKQSDAPDWQRAGRVWFDADPHAHAYTTLLSDASQRIVDRLVGPTPVESLEYQQVLEAKCVSCHASELAPLSERALGADCQVCHGPADAWGEEHYAQATLAKGPHRFENTRRIDMESLTNRAKVCSSCHVGQLNRDGAEREVDHRLMAAGHPTTYFDFGNYLERYPTHWDQAAEDARLGATAAYQKWRVGKMQTAIARVRLLCDRANRNEEWPEFTEYSCTSCHHELAAPAWRPIASNSPKNSRSSGRPVWDDWYIENIELAFDDLATVPAIEPTDLEQKAVEILDSVRQLRQMMERPFPEIDKVVVTSGALLRKLSLAPQPLSIPSIDVPLASDVRARLRLALNTLLASETEAFSWEQGAQWTIATRAIAKTLGLKVPEIAFGNRVHLGFFGTPTVWILGQPSTFESSYEFQPSLLMEYRDSLRSQLESTP